MVKSEILDIIMQDIKIISEIYLPNTNRCPINNCNNLRFETLCLYHHCYTADLENIITNKHQRILKLMKENKLNILDVSTYFNEKYNELWNEHIKYKDLLSKQYLSTPQYDSIICYVSDKYSFDAFNNYNKFIKKLHYDISKKFDEINDMMLYVNSRSEKAKKYFDTNIINIHKFLITYDYKINNVSCDQKYDINIKDKIINEYKYIYSKLYYKITKKRIYSRHKQDMIDYILDIPYVEHKFEDIECTNGRKTNYNESLYNAIYKIENKYKNILFIDREKIFLNLNDKGCLRYDLFGILIDSFNLQIYFFVIELDGNEHYNSKGVRVDLIKEIYALYNCYSILRIYDKDDIYENINKFIDNILTNKKPCVMYSQNKYNDRYNKIKNSAINNFEEKDDFFITFGRNDESYLVENEQVKLVNDDDIQIVKPIIKLNKMMKVKPKGIKLDL